MPLASFAQAAFPDRPIKLIVPFAAGGATDVLARIVSIGMSEKLGQPVVIENKPGASTLVGAMLVAKAPPDGYTLLVGSVTTLTLLPALRTNLPYDPIRGFTHIGPMAAMDLVVIVNQDSPVATLKDLIDGAKSSPGKVSYATFGAGSSVHFGAAMLLNDANIQMVHVPFNGSTPMITALLGNQVNSAFDSAVASAPFIKSGKLKALAVLSPQRSPMFPDVPTAAESGYPNVNMGSWFTMLGPPGLPAPVQRKLETTLAQVLKTPTVKKQLLDLGLTATPGTGASDIARVERELPQMRAVAARANMKLE
jgi:tripartite-type tricarboxylate transporter receptor subunit TctC